MSTNEQEKQIEAILKYIRRGVRLENIMQA